MQGFQSVAKLDAKTGDLEGKGNVCQGNVPLRMLQCCVRLPHRSPSLLQKRRALCRADLLLHRGQLPLQLLHAGQEDRVDAGEPQGVRPGGGRREFTRVAQCRDQRDFPGTLGGRSLASRVYSRVVTAREARKLVGARRPETRFARDINRLPASILQHRYQRHDGQGRM
jgi:hypothetical protein